MAAALIGGDVEEVIMEAAYLSAVSALAGSVVGGLTSGITTWMSQRSQLKAGYLVRETERREDLFRNFILSASKSYGNALTSDEPEIQQIVGLYAMISQMRVLCSPNLVASVDKVLQATVVTYFGPNHSLRELHVVIKKGVGVDPLKEFSEVARSDLLVFASLLH